jgi:hypothetical protein
MSYQTRNALGVFLLLLTPICMSCDKKDSSTTGGGAGTQPAGSPARAPTTPPPPTASQALPYELKQMGAATVAQFKDWKTVPIKDDASGSALGMVPEGHEKEFDLTVFISAPGSAHEVDQLFTVGPHLVQQAAPGLSKVGEAKESKFAGDSAMTEEYQGTVGDGTAVSARVIYVKKKDIAVIVIGRGVPEAFKKYSPAIDIVAQSIAFKEGSIPSNLAGKWKYDSQVKSALGAGNAYSKSAILTIFPNGTFSYESTEFADRLGTGNESWDTKTGRGTATARGNLLTFTFDDGKTANASLDGNEIVYNSERYKRSQ